MINKILAGLAALAAVVLGFLKVFSMGGKSKANEIKAQQESKAREVEKASKVAMIDGMKKEDKIKNEKVDTTNRDHFS